VLEKMDDVTETIVTLVKNSLEVDVLSAPITDVLAMTELLVIIRLLLTKLENVISRLADVEVDIKLVEKLELVDTDPPLVLDEVLDSEELDVDEMDDSIHEEEDGTACGNGLTITVDIDVPGGVHCY
jgi:hypothetical protein